MILLSERSLQNAITGAAYKLLDLAVRPIVYCLGACSVLYRVTRKDALASAQLRGRREHRIVFGCEQELAYLEGHADHERVFTNVSITFRVLRALRGKFLLSCQGVAAWWCRVELWKRWSLRGTLIVEKWEDRFGSDGILQEGGPGRNVIVDRREGFKGKSSAGNLRHSR